MDKQQQLEQEALDKSVSRIRKQQQTAIANERETTTATGRIALSGAIQPLAVAIDAWVEDDKAGYNKKYKPYFKLLNSELTAVVIARTVLDGISKDRKRTALAGSIGRAIQQEYQLQEFKKNHKDLFAVKLKELETETDSTKESMMLNDLRREGICSKEWSKRDTIHIGMVALMMMEKYTGLIKLIEVKEGKNLVGRVTPSADMSAWLEESYNKTSMYSFIYEPMVVKPRDWTNAFDGGYLLTEFQNKGLFVNDKGKHDKIQYHTHPSLFDAVNHLQGTGWRVNKEVLDKALELWESNSQVGGLPNRDFYPEPSKPLLSDDKVSWARYYKRVNITRRANNLNLGQRYRTSDTLRMADKFKDESHIYFPYHLDFRGRAYPFVKSLSPQGDDLAKGLLHFAEAKPIVNKEQETYFYVHGANMFGIKGTIQERYDWVVKNREWLLRTGDDPRYSLWGSVSKPFQFLAWVLEFKDYERYGQHHLSRIPIAMDGSCNGLQLISLLLKDENMGRSTNCTPQDVPADLYQEVADEVKRRLQENPDNTNLKILKLRNIDRSLMKKAVMTVPYGATYFTIYNMFLSLFVDEHAKAFAYNAELGQGHRTMASHSARLARVTWDTIKDIIPNAIKFNKWLRQTIKPLITDNQEISWVSPIGIRVYQEYKTEISSRITTAIGTKIRRNTRYKEETDTLSVGRNNYGIMPNYIHSLDASVMLMTTNHMKELGVDNLSMVHDSFATHALDAPKLAKGLRKIVTEIFSENLLNLFDMDTLGCYPNLKESRTRLERGALDINQLTKSLYFFH